MRYIDFAACLTDGATGQCVFFNRQGQPLTRDGIAYILNKYVTAAANDNPALLHKYVTQHVLRHICAAALLQSGTDVTVIRDYSAIPASQRQVVTSRSIYK